MRLLFLLISLFYLISCDSFLYGTGNVFLTNATDRSIELTLQGRTVKEIHLKGGQSQIWNDCVAGEYQLQIKKMAEPFQMISTQIIKDRLTIVNVEGAACLVRADVAGMYTGRKAPVRVLEVYKGDWIISIPDEIFALPGESLPAKRPKATDVFQRLDIIPCEIADQQWQIEDLLHKRR